MQLKRFLHKITLFTLTLTMSGLLCVNADAAVTAIGDINPPDPNTWTDITTVNIGDTGVGSVTVDGGSSLISGITYLGDAATGEGTILVTGAGSIWTVDNGFYVGYQGKATIRIEDGATLASLGIGVGWQVGSISNMTVTGPTTNWTSDSVYVGYEGTGTLLVADGATVTSSHIYIGEMTNGNGTATITGAGTNWTSTGDVWVGYRKTGTLNITDGATLSCVAAQIGGQSTCDGVVNIEGAGSTWTLAEEFTLGATGPGALNLRAGGRFTVGRDILINATQGTFTWTGGTLEINGNNVYVTDEEFTVPSGGLLTGTGYFGAGTTQIVAGGGQSQYTGGNLFTSGGAGYLITAGTDYTLAMATYSILPSGSIQQDNLWKLEAGDNIYSFSIGDNFALNANDVFTTVGDCTGADSLNFDLSSGGTININHEATIAAYSAASMTSWVLGTGGKLNCTSGIDLRNAGYVTINIDGADFLAGRTVADMGNGSWIVDPAKVTLNVARSGNTGTVVLATSLGAKGMTADGVTEISQTDLDSWIANLDDSYSIGYDGFSLLLERLYVPPESGDSNEVVVDKLISSGAIVLPAGATTKDVITGQTVVTASSQSCLAAAKKFGTTLTSRIGSSAASAGWGARGTMASNNDTIRGQQLLRDYRRGKTSLWIENVGAWTTQDAVDETTTGYNASLLGMQLGIDRMFGRNLLAGISYGGAWAMTHSDSQQMMTNIFDLQLYGAWRVSRNLRFVGSVGYQYMIYDGQFLGEDSSHVGNMFKMAGTVEYDIHLGRIVLTPIYGWEYYKTEESAYETGQFAVDGNATEAIYQRCGMRVGVICHPRIKVDLHSSWLRNCGDENIIFSAASGGTPFQLTGAPLHRNLAEVGVDTTIALTGRLDLTVGYLGVYANGFDTQSVNGLLRWNF